MRSDDTIILASGGKCQRQGSPRATRDSVRNLAEPDLEIGNEFLIFYNTGLSPRPMSVCFK